MAWKLKRLIASEPKLDWNEFSWIKKKESSWNLINSLSAFNSITFFFHCVWKSSFRFYVSHLVNARNQPQNHSICYCSLGLCLRPRDANKKTNFIGWAKDRAMAILVYGFPNGLRCAIINLLMCFASPPSKWFICYNNTRFMHPFRPLFFCGLIYEIN